MSRASGFDRIARCYCWLEYLCFGGQLARCRLHRLAGMAGARRCLVIGDGDGRFTAALMASNNDVEIVAVDGSEVMLSLLSARVRRIGGPSRLTVIRGDAVRLLAETGGHSALSPIEGFDLVCTHFFLDCLSSVEIGRLVDGVCWRLAADARWIVSEFATPSWWTRLVVKLLYRAFALLTGLQVRYLPMWREALLDRGFTCIHEAEFRAGLLTSSAWEAAAERLKQPRSTS